MAANVESILELGLREAAETVWARKVVLEALGPLAPAGILVEVARAHAKAIGRAEGTAFALELVRGHAGDGETGIDLLGRALADIGENVWDAGRLALEGEVRSLSVTLACIPTDLSWAAASTSAAASPLYPKP